jgi:signal transduction histidine kinase
MDSRTTRWQRGWRPPSLLGDILLPLVLTVAVQVEAGWIATDPGPAVSALLITLPLVWRRRLPLPVFGIVLAGVILTFFVNTLPASSALVYTALSALVIAAYSIGVYSRRRLAAAGVLVATATMVVVVFGSNDSLPSLPSSLAPFALLLVPFLMGQALRTRDLRAEALRERAMRLEQEQEFAARAAATEERERIARELHDVIAHTVSVMVVQAGAARHVMETEPGQARDALTAVETTGREAMAEMRNLLGVLTPSDGEALLGPQPGIAQIPALVQRVRGAGLPADLQVTGEPRALSPGIDLTVYRIVQEALTNALKYAGQVHTEVTLDYREDTLKVEVLDDGVGGHTSPGARTGRGLAGMRERVALFGGTLEAGPRLGHGYAVRAWLPLRGEA